MGSFSWVNTWAVPVRAPFLLRRSEERNATRQRSSWFPPTWKTRRAGWRAGGGWPNCLILIYCVCLGVGAAGEHRLSEHTTVYDAPEISIGSLSPAADVWSLGVTMVEALSQRAPVGREKLFLPNTVPPHFADIARHCLVRDPQSRWTLQ